MWIKFFFLKLGYFLGLEWVLGFMVYFFLCNFIIKINFLKRKGGGIWIFILIFFVNLFYNDVDIKINLVLVIVEGEGI